uniref:Uncharacterized protein n=1 Tax=Arundo donax TaxID=35708 RepID=A0A0A9FCN6_ARUDO
MNPCFCFLYRRFRSRLKANLTY